METEIDEKRFFLWSIVEWTNHVFAECRRAAPYPNREDFPSLALFLHMIIMANGIRILLSAGTSDPIISLLRSMLEALFSLKYIHLNQYKLRSLCWLCAYIHGEIALHEKVDGDSDKGKELHSILSEEYDVGLTNGTLSSLQNKDEISKLRAHLKQADLIEIDKEYTRLQQEDRFHRPPKWYRLFGGPNSIFKLAKEVRMLSAYKMQYELWSATVHCSDANRFLFHQEDGTAEFRPFHSLEDPDDKERDAIVFLQLACRSMIRVFLAGRDQQKLINSFSSKLQGINKVHFEKLRKSEQFQNYLALFASSESKNN
jgi:hypothetical protein